MSRSLGSHGLLGLSTRHGPLVAFLLWSSSVAGCFASGGCESQTRACRQLCGSWSCQLWLTEICPCRTFCSRCNRLFRCPLIHRKACGQSDSCLTSTGRRLPWDGDGTAHWIAPPSLRWNEAQCFSVRFYHSGCQIAYLRSVLRVYLISRSSALLLLQIWPTSCSRTKSPR